MDKKRILFVDDEPNILDGLRRMLRSLRKEYELCFAENGNSALELMADKNIDIVVSDMRMPGMDGAQFLDEVKAKYPHAIRIMLTGQADEESIMRTVGVVHQLLAKPCDPDNLKEILKRTSALQDMMCDGDLKDVISSIDSLPSLPQVYSDLQKAFNDPEVTIAQIGDIIAKDIAMSAKILQLVNSSFFGLFTKVETPERAVSLLGLDTIKALVLGLEIFSEVKVPGKEAFIENLWRHSMAVGAMAKEIAFLETDDEKIANECFIAGILHDVGILIILSKMGDKFDEIHTAAIEDEKTIFEAENEILKATHCAMGSYLAGLWGFPSSVIEGIGFYYQLENYPGESFSIALAIHVANCCYYEKYNDDIIGKKVEMNKEYIQEAGCAEKLDTWVEKCNEILEDE